MGGLHCFARSARVAFAIAAGSILSVACSGSNDSVIGPKGPRVSTVAVLPETTSVLIQKTIQLSALVRDSSGTSLVNRQVAWTSSDTSVITVDSRGLAQGRSAGSARVSAAVEGVTGQALLSVIRPAIDSISTGNDSAVVAVGQGTSVIFAQGTLPPGTKVRVEEIPDVNPIPDAALMGHPISISFTVVNDNAAVSLPLLANAAQSANGLGSLQVVFRTKVSQSINQLSDRTYVAVREAGNAASQVVVKADNVIEKVDQFGQRFVETKLIIPTINAGKGAYNFVVFVNSLGQPICSESAWSLTKVSLSPQDNALSTNLNRVPLILVHGIQLEKLSCQQVENYHPEAESEAWSALISALKTDPQIKNRFEVWVYRYPTYYPIAENSQHLKTLIDQKLLGRQTAIIGHSMGGLVAAKYMIDDGSRVKTLISLSTPFGGTPLARDNPLSLTALAAYAACTDPRVGVAARMLAYLVLRKSEAVQMDPQSAIITSLGANRSVFGPRLRTYAASFNWLTDNLTVSRLLYVVGGCLMTVQGFLPNDGMVPVSATVSSGGQSLGYIQNLTLPGLDHEEIHSATSTIQQLVFRLGILANQIPTAAQSIQDAGGNHQNAAPGASLPQLLAVRAVDAVGVPVAGTTITFAVTSGVGTVTPASSSTDNDGFARTTWRLGSPAGTQGVSATAVGLAGSPILFDAFAGTAPANSCPTQSYTIGSTVSGSLATTDCRFSDPPFGTGSYLDSFESSSTNAQAIHIVLTASFQPAIGVQGPFDRAGSYTHSIFSSSGSRSIVANVLVPAGTFTIRPSAVFAQTTGAYTLSSASVSPDVRSCDLTIVLPGTDSQQNLEASDCSSGGYYSDQYRIGIPVGATITIEENSSAFDAVLSLAKESGSMVASDDDGAGGTDSFLRYTSSDNVVYVITASSFDPRATGSYRIRVSLAYPGASLMGVKSATTIENSVQGTPNSAVPSPALRNVKAPEPRAKR